MFSGQPRQGEGLAQPARLGELDVHHVGRVPGHHLAQVPPGPHRFVGEHRGGHAGGDEAQAFQVVSVDRLFHQLDVCPGVFPCADDGDRLPRGPALVRVHPQGDVGADRLPGPGRRGPPPGGVRPGPPAPRPAASVATSSPPAPVLTLSVRNPAATCSTAVRSSSRVSTAVTAADSVMSVRNVCSRPPRYLNSGTPAARAARSYTAHSTAIRAEELRTTARSSAALASAGSSAGMPATAAPSGPSTAAVTLATLSPVTRQLVGASPQPLRPSLSRTSTSTASTSYAARTAVTNGRTRGTERR